jgi:hypothetical protein
VASSYANFTTAFLTKTNVSAVVGSGKLSGIFEGKAPAKQAKPYGIYNLQAASPITYGFNVTQLAETNFIQLRVYADTPETAHTNLDNWVATLGNSLTVTGFTIGWLARENDLPPTDQLIAGEYVYGRGCLIRYTAE